MIQTLESSASVAPGPKWITLRTSCEHPCTLLAPGVKNDSAFASVKTSWLGWGVRGRGLFLIFKNPARCIKGCRGGKGASRENAQGVLI